MGILFIFRRDLRTHDNTALNNAIELSKKTNLPIHPIFIFNHKQVQSDYSSNNSIQFMIESLLEVNDNLKSKLSCFFKPLMESDIEIIQNFKNIQHIFFNIDFTHFAKKRDNDIQTWCNKNNITLHSFEDYTLHSIDQIQTSSKKFYEVFTPFYNKAITIDPPKQPITLKTPFNNFQSLSDIKHIITLNDALKKFIPEINQDIIVRGGSSHAKKIITNILKHKDYDKTRSIPAFNTSLLSAYIKFGNISIRETYYAFKKTSQDLVRQLYWREFYYVLFHNLPKDKTIGKSNYKSINIKWPHFKPSLFSAWCNGETGFPFIDAGMRQLNKTGWMHNRARMACANFLVFILHIDWRKGEQYFATKLVDYDIAQNNGNWQWNAGVGVDKTGYLRIYSPTQQSLKFDKDCKYIFKWIPELSDIQPSLIHKLKFSIPNYPNTIVDYDKQRKLAPSLFS